MANNLIHHENAYDSNDDELHLNFFKNMYLINFVDFIDNIQIDDSPMNWTYENESTMNDVFEKKK